MSENNSGPKSKFLTQNFLTGILLIVVGILFCVFRAQLVSILLTVVGVIAIVIGVINLVNRFYVPGAIQIVVGILLIAGGWVIVDITLLILGIVLIAYAIYLVVRAVPGLKGADAKTVALTVAYPALLLIFGILLVVARWFMLDVIFIIGGVLSILAGAAMVIKR